MTLSPEHLRELAKDLEENRDRLLGAVLVVFADVPGHPEEMRALVASVVGEMSREQVFHDAIEELEHRYLDMLRGKKP